MKSLKNLFSKKTNQSDKKPEPESQLNNKVSNTSKNLCTTCGGKGIHINHFWWAWDFGSYSDWISQCLSCGGDWENT